MRSAQDDERWWWPRGSAPSPELCPPNSQSPGPAPAATLVTLGRLNVGKDQAESSAWGWPRGMQWVGAAPAFWDLPEPLRSWAQTQRGGLSPKFHSPAVTAEENLPANLKRHGSLMREGEKGRQEGKGKGRRWGEASGDIWVLLHISPLAPPFIPSPAHPSPRNSL